MGKISFEKARKRISAQRVTTYDMRERWGLSPVTVDHIRKDKPISTKCVGVLCDKLACQPGDLMEYREEEKGDV